MATSLPPAATALPPAPTLAPPSATAARPLVPGAGNQLRPAGAPVQSFEVLASYPHDPAAYTQGLLYVHDDTFYESTGYWEDSSLREVELATGTVRRHVMLNDRVPPPPGAQPHFAEGLALVGENLFQLTWQSGFGLIYDQATFTLQGQFRYPPDGQQLPREGWGLTTMDDQLLMSDGSANIYLIDPAATIANNELAIISRIEVHDANGPVMRLNELEYIQGELYANLWQSDLIARIDPASGRVHAYIDLSPLRALLPAGGRPEVLNGIAYDPTNDRIFVTGKWWPTLFAIRLQPVAVVFLPHIMA
ncbi:MAG: glutaminyl-peptide cyclotransferase [Candidatus Viridilinea halotolerans]|uniref:Glutaminyl-peptide cyclotransferase n=1 Tax=Candidatus Viridilinea halotolerans TaxID=2491704 RepID=A0A426TXH9_9CHLR|nr:MAG: glutaminyl-peptide cyclotransferase [Candidatus Viridilinea halotolerans]